MQLEPKTNSATARELLASQPKHRRVSAELIQRIRSGDYASGRLLPSEPELASEFAVSRHTIRMALRSLYEKGLILTQQGKGSVVQPTATSPTYTFACDSIADLMQYAAATTRRVMSTRRLKVDAPLAEWLGCEPNSYWWTVQQSRYREECGDVVAISEIYVPDAFEAAIRKFADSKTPLIMLMESMYDHTIAQVRQNFSVASASEADAGLLGVAHPSVVMCVERRFFDERGGLLEVSKTINPPDSFEYEITINQVIGSPTT